MEDGSMQPRYSRDEYRIFAVGLLLTVVALSVFLWIVVYRKDVSAPVVSAAAPTADIAITTAGFNPSTVIVNSGTTVKWQNQTAAPQQVGANPFPSHSSLPGLYAVKPIAPNGNYTYTFAHAGTYEYDNYLNPTQNGTVIVR